jgi:protoporphyrin/coproporphyrin ferrochelatase
LSGGCDAILLVAFGGPSQASEIRPFLAHVLRGRPVPPGRIEEVAHHYEVIGGRSPLPEITERQRARLQARLHERGVDLPISLGMRHSQPFVADVLRDLVDRGARHVLVVIMAAFHDRATVERYMQAVTDAARDLSVTITLRECAGPSDHPGFIEANVDHVRAAFRALPSEYAQDARLVFTAHSVPTDVGLASGYVRMFEDTAQRVAQGLGTTEYLLAYQSRSGSPRDPWLEPDIGEVVRNAAAQGHRALVLSPIGFVCDHVEVLYDLDIEAKQIADAVGVTLARASTANDHPAYIEALADRVCEALVTRDTR